jgi:flagellar hook-associated protein 3 FlgL
MEVRYTSTKALNQGNRLNVLRLQQQLVEAQQEVATGRLYDIGRDIGSRTAETVSLRQQHARFTTLIDTNGVVQTRLNGSQTALNDVLSVAQDFVGAMLVAKDAEGGAQVAQQSAEASLKALQDGLNTTIGGEYLFAGINSTAEPVANYYSTPTSAARTAVNSAFTAAFGTTQSDPANVNITPAALQSFLDTSFAGLFAPSSWSADWSTASNQNIVSRISLSEDVVSSANANESPFRKLAQAYTMVADLGAQNLNETAFAALAETAAKLAGEAIQELTAVQARLGTSAERVSSSNTKMTAQQNVLNTQIDNLEAVDPFEAATRVTTLMTQLQTAYALTARVQQLTILNYL